MGKLSTLTMVNEMGVISLTTYGALIVFMEEKKAIPDFQHTPEAPMPTLRPSTTDTASQILTTLRQLEPEDQNEVVKTLLTELAVDRFNSARAAREAGDRASKNVEVFMENALHLEKILSEMKIG